MKKKMYKKQELRLTLERNMRERRKEPELTVTPMEFSRWLQYFVERFDLDPRICQAKTLEEPIVDGFGEWLGDPLR
jgi:hypothetical protein